MDLTELTLVALTWNPKTKKVDQYQTTKDRLFQGLQYLEKKQSEGHWTVGKFVYITKTGEYAGAW